MQISHLKHRILHAIVGKAKKTHPAITAAERDTYVNSAGCKCLQYKVMRLMDGAYSKLFETSDYNEIIKARECLRLCQIILQMNYLDDPELLAERTNVDGIIELIGLAERLDQKNAETKEQETDDDD